MTHMWGATEMLQTLVVSAAEGSGSEGTAGPKEGEEAAGEAQPKGEGEPESEGGSSSSVGATEGGSSSKKKQKKNKGEKGSSVVEVCVEKRRGRKMWTFITGLEDFGVEPRAAAKELQKLLAAGVSASRDASGAPLIECHGDARMQLVGHMVREWGVPVRSIVVKEGKSKEPGSNYLF